MIPKEWLVKMTSLDRVEPLIQPRDHTHTGYLFVHHDEWEQFKKRIEEGDELWEFRSPPETWETGGWEGYVIVRNGEPLHTVLFAKLW